MPAAFPNQITMSDVWELIKRVQNRDVSTDTLKLSLWIAGSGIEQFDGKEDSPVFGSTSLEQMTLDLSEAIEELSPTFQEGGVTYATNKELNPTIKALLKLLIKMLLESW